MGENVNISISHRHEGKKENISFTPMWKHKIYIWGGGGGEERDRQRVWTAVFQFRIQVAKICIKACTKRKINKSPNVWHRNVTNTTQVFGKMHWQRFKIKNKKSRLIFGSPAVWPYTLHANLERHQCDKGVKPANIEWSPLLSWPCDPACKSGEVTCATGSTTKVIPLIIITKNSIKLNGNFKKGWGT